jgi:enolase
MFMSEIAKLQALEILDSRGNPTLAVTVTLANGVTATAKVPSGASTGKREAVELRDGDKARYGGKGVLKAKGHAEGEIQSAIRGFDANDQKGLDKTLCELDRTSNKGRLGANAILGASLAVAHATAKDHGLPLYATLVKNPANLLPTPGLNVLNGASTPIATLTSRNYDLAGGCSVLQRSIARSRRDIPRIEGGAEQEGLQHGCRR